MFSQSWVVVNGMPALPIPGTNVRAVPAPTVASFVPLRRQRRRRVRNLCGGNCTRRRRRSVSREAARRWCRCRCRCSRFCLCTGSGSRRRIRTPRRLRWRCSRKSVLSTLQVTMILGMTTTNTVRRVLFGGVIGCSTVPQSRPGMSDQRSFVTSASVETRPLRGRFDGPFSSAPTAAVSHG